MSENHKKVFVVLNYFKKEKLLILGFGITGFISIPAFTSLVCTPIGSAGSVVGLLRELKRISQ